MKFCAFFFFLFFFPVPTSPERKILTRETNFRKMNTVWNQHQIPDAFGLGLFPCQVTGALFVLGCSAEGRYSATRLKVETSTRSYQVIGRRSISQA